MAIDDNPAVNTTLSPPDSQAAGVASKVSWPGAFGLFKYSKAAISLNLGAIIIILLIQFAVYMTIGLVLEETVATFVQLVVGVFIQAALVLTYLASVRGKRVSAGDQLSKSPQFFIQLFVLQLLVGFSISIGLLLFIVPGLILLTRLFIAQYYLIDKNMGAVEAYKASLAATKGNTGKVWGIIGASFVMALPAITIIGIPVTIYLLFMYAAAAALLYQYLTTGSLGPEEAVATQQPPTPLTPPDAYTFNQQPQQTVQPQQSTQEQPPTQQNQQPPQA